MSELTKQMLGYRLVTKQTPADGVEVKKVSSVTVTLHRRRGHDCHSARERELNGRGPARLLGERR